MKHVLTHFYKLLLLMLTTVASHTAWSQCPDDGVLYDVDLTPAGPGETGSFGCVYGGEFYYFTAVAGETYYVTSCGTPWDSQLTMRDDFGNLLAYDDESAPCGNGAAAITWTATYSGQVKVQINEFDCASNSSCGDLAVTWQTGAVILGCTDATAINYNPDATVDDGSCIFLEGCTNEFANNYNPDASVDDGSCTFDFICDCSGTPHTAGVLIWLGDGFVDNGAYQWEGQPVNFNCATWGFDCGDITGAPAQDPYGVCSGQLPPNNGCSGEIVFGCTDPTANNYNALATVDDGSCTYEVFGCTDPSAYNYDALATVDDGSCTYEVFGCTDPSANNYNALATVDDGSCTFDVFGCMDPFANNYNPDANIDDMSCLYGSCGMFMITAVQQPCELDNAAVLLPVMDFTYTFSGGCEVESFVFVNDMGEFPVAATAANNMSGSTVSYLMDANTIIGIYIILTDGTQSPLFEFLVGDCSQDALICDCAGNAHTIGVLTWIGDAYADNGTYTWAGSPVDFNCATWGYDCGDIAGAPAEDPHGVCDGNLPPNNGCGADVILGCTDASANNYDENATVDDGSCTYDVLGCTDQIAINYNPDANVDDGSCVYNVFGCTDPSANNYNALATVDDGSCTFDVFGCMDPLANNYNPDANIDDMSCLYGSCGEFMITGVQQPCEPDNAGVLFPVMDFTYTFSGGCEVESFVFVNDMGEFPVATTAANNMSGSTISYLVEANATTGIYVILTDGTESPVFEFLVGDCSQDALICDCAGNAHTIGVLTWIGDAYADNGTYTWAGSPVDFNCATWGYDCGDIAGAPAEDPHGVCDGNLPPNNGCGADVILGCTDVTANNFNPDATLNDGSCLYDTCSNLILDAVQMPCTQDDNGVLNPALDFTFTFDGECTVASLVVIADGTEFPFDVPAPANVSGSVFSLFGFVSNTVYEAYFVLTDGTVSPTLSILVGDCLQDALICDCAGTVHTIGVMNWLGDTYADNGAYNWVGQPVDFNCATWGYDCGDIAGAPTADTYGVCSGNLPPNNGCITDVLGCTDPTANNFNTNATVDDGSCTYNVLGCTDITAANYDATATVDDGSCVYAIYGCTDASATNYNASATVDDGSCMYVVFGCTDPTANNFNAEATVNDGSCTYDVLGCTDPTAANYNASATVDDGSCMYIVFGCTDPTANNFNAEATVNDGSCTYDVLGCTDPTANNYNPDANVDDGSCTYGTCDNIELTAVQTPCFQDNAGNLIPGMDFIFSFDGGCTVDSLVITVDGGVFPLVVNAPNNVSGSAISVAGIPVNSAITVYYVLTDGTVSSTFEFAVGDCSQDPVICDCDGNEHTIGVLSRLGDTFADNATYTWGGVTVNFNCATWGYDCGDIVGAPTEDPYGVCAGNLPPQNGCVLNVSEIGSSTLMEAYPNPTTGLLTIVSLDGSELKQIRVFDQSGKLLMNEQRVMVNGVGQQLDLTSLAAGSYHIQIVGLSHVSNVSVIVQK